MMYHQESQKQSTSGARTSFPRTADADASPPAIAESTKRQDVIYYNQALEYANEEHWHDVKTLVEKAIALRSDEAEYYSLLGVAYLSLRDNHAALAQFRLAYRLDKDDPLLQPYMQFLLFGNFGLNDSNSLPRDWESEDSASSGSGTAPL